MPTGYSIDHYRDFINNVKGLRAFFYKVGPLGYAIFEEGYNLGNCLYELLE